MTERTLVVLALLLTDGPLVRVARPDRTAQIAAVLAARLHEAAWANARSAGKKPKQARQDGCPRM
jgi:hypothetical protein